MKFHEIIAVLAASMPLLATADGSVGMPSRAYHADAPAPVAFRAAALVPIDIVSLAPLQEKALAATEGQPGGRLRVGTVRALAKAARVDAWKPAAGGHAVKLRASSEQALGLRVRLDLGTLPGAIEARVQGTDGRMESMLIDPMLGTEAWTPWTEGSVQVIELFSPVLPSPEAVRVGAVLHFTDSPLAPKAAAASCTVPTMCTTNDPTLDAAIAERKKSVVKLTFVDNGSGFLCSGTLINTERFPAAYVLTANHCIDNAASAASIATIWFYEDIDCDSGVANPNSVQVNGGAQIVFTNYNVDSTLLLLNRVPPAGAVYSGWNPARLTAGAPIVSISHPEGDTSRYALGTIDKEYRIEGYPQDEYGVLYSRGIIQGGSSGSGLFTLGNGSLQLRGILTGTTVRREPGLSCTNLTEDGLYSRFEIFEPEIDQYIRIAPQAADDAPNRAQDLFNAPVTDPSGVDMPLNLRATPLVFLNRRIDYAGDLDVFRFILTAPSTVTVGTEGTLDTVGSILDSRGVSLEANDDADTSADHTNFNFGITRTLDPGTYYVQVGAWDALVTGAYTLRLSATSSFDTSSANYTDLWWNSAESGWGINLNHQGNIIFATLFTYDASGPMWLVMSEGDKQSDGSYLGTLYRTTGPVFNAVPWSSITPTSVGTLRLAFSATNAGTLTYAVNGTTVTKSITRQVFSTPPTCTWTTSDRSAASNYQDLWWNPAESGWGVNISHQGNTLFATLFTYDATGRGLWLVMSNGNRTGTGAYSGTLYQTSGPVFNASPWTAVTPTAAGTMSFLFSNGNSGTMTYNVNGVQVTKAIQRQVFSTPLTQCN